MFTLNCKGKMLVIDDAIVMGIINTTPDSFYAGSRKGTVDDVLFTAEKMLQDGAAILDLGGQSTRPGSNRVSKEEELKRVLPAIEAVSERFPDAIISIDSFYADVATGAVHAGASIINDVSGGKYDAGMAAAVAALQVPYVLMHIKGEPENMQEKPFYNNVTLEVFDQLAGQLKILQSAGIHDVIIDPGFGFGKTIEHNFQLLRELSFFKNLDRPVLAGVSRKATIYKTLGCLPEEALNGTTAIHTIALLQGANILRVHDVKEACEVIKLVRAVQGEKKEQPWGCS